jgi:hypothetical protein
VAYVAHETDLNRTTDGVSLRDVLTEKLRRGEPVGAQLDGPDLPEPLFYLYEWSHELFGRSGVGPNGFAPLSYTTIRDWAILTGNDPSLDDVQALIRLDQTMLATEPVKTPEPVAVSRPAWPEKKRVS